MAVKNGTFVPALLAYLVVLTLGRPVNGDQIDPPDFGHFDLLPGNPELFMGDLTYTAAPTPEYLLVDGEVTDSTTNQMTNEWVEFNAPAGEDISVVLHDPSSDNLTLSSVGYLLSDTLIPLDQLNLDALPPTNPISGSPSLSSGSPDFPFTVPADAPVLTPLPTSLWGGLVLLAGVFVGRKISPCRN